MKQFKKQLREPGKKEGNKGTIFPQLDNTMTTKKWGNRVEKAILVGVMNT